MKAHRTRWILGLIALVVIVAAVLSTKRVPIGVDAAASADTFDPVAFAEENYTDLVEVYIDDNATDLTILLQKLADGAPEQDFGNAPGAASSFSFPIKVVGVAGPVDGSAIPLEVSGIDDTVTVQVQIGPVLNGTALRDVSGQITFDKFTNQLEFQQVSQSLNTVAKTRVLDPLDVEALDGRTIVVVGAFSRVNPDLVSIVPTRVEVES